jgi:cell division protein FtsB
MPLSPQLPPRRSSHPHAVRSSPPIAKRRRRRRGIPFPLRIAGLAVLGILGAFIALSIIKKTIHPYILDHQEGTRIARLQAHLDRENAVNAGLEKNIAYLKSEEGMENQARSKGYHIPGEVVYLLDNSPTSKTSPSTMRPNPAP